MVAAAVGTWRLTYHVGERGVDDGGSVRFAWRDTSDWTELQSDHPSPAEYATVVTNGQARLRYQRPFRACVTVDVFDGWLRRGETVVLTLDDRSGGSAETFADSGFEFRVAVDWSGACRYTVVNGAPFRLVAVGTSRPDAAGKIWLGVRGEDRWATCVATSPAA